MGYPTSDEEAKAYEELRKAFKEFGLGTTTGIDLPNESAGISRSVDFMKKFNSDNGAQWYSPVTSPILRSVSLIRTHRSN